MDWYWDLHNWTELHHQHPKQWQSVSSADFQLRVDLWEWLTCWMPEFQPRWTLRNLRTGQAEILQNSARRNAKTGARVGINLAHAGKLKVPQSWQQCHSHSDRIQASRKFPVFSAKCQFELLGCVKTLRRAQWVAAKMDKSWDTAPWGEAPRGAGAEAQGPHVQGQR